jgi:hypothetical protein
VKSWNLIDFVPVREQYSIVAVLRVPTGRRRRRRLTWRVA